MASIEEIATTLRDVVKPGMGPKDLRAAVREKHADASKKEIVRAAFYALTEMAGPKDADTDLHGFAINERGSEEDLNVPAKTSRSRKKKTQAGKSAKPPVY